VNRAVAIVRNAGRNARTVATETYTKVARPAKTAKAKTTRARKAKRTVRKARTKAKARAK